jgi:RPA family protein
MAQLRETAWRIFAVELNSSTLEDQGEGDKAPLYLVSALGAKVNRVFVSGVVTDLENTGSETEPLWRARVNDPTGVFYISAGQYQPEAAHILANIKPPEFVAIIGKIRTYKPESGVMYISIRPEIIKVIDAKRRDLWVLETCRQMSTRIDAMREANKMEPFDAQKLMSLGYPRTLVDGISMALKHYTDTDLDRYHRMCVESVRYLLDESGERLLEPKEYIAPKVKAQETVAPKTKKTEDKPAKGKVSGGFPPKGPAKGPQVKIEEMKIPDEGAEITPEEEQALLEIVGELEEQGGGMALWQDIMDSAIQEGMERSRAEETLNLLQAKGELQEPSIGKIRRV